MEYTREQAEQVFKDFNLSKKMFFGLEFTEEVNPWEEAFFKHKFPQEETYSIGDRFQIYGYRLVLACTMDKHVALICIDTGRRVEQAVRVEQVEKVTQKEFRSIFPTEELFNRVTKIK
jgi:hypothetical protein